MSPSNSSWDLSQERVFVENLLSQRFNFFIVIFSLVIAGSAGANTQIKLVSILWVGEVLCVLVALTIYRIYVKVIWVLRLLHRIPDHPVALSGVAVKKLGKLGLFGVNSIIGIIIPAICCSVLLAGAILASIGILHSK